MVANLSRNTKHLFCEPGFLTHWWGAGVAIRRSAIDLLPIRKTDPKKRDGSLATAAGEAVCRKGKNCFSTFMTTQKSDDGGLNLGDIVTLDTKNSSRTSEK